VTTAEGVGCVGPTLLLLLRTSFTVKFRVTSGDFLVMGAAIVVAVSPAWTFNSNSSTSAAFG